MNQPGGLCIDTAGRLWVADSGNNRVLRFDNAATKVNGADADGVLGQQNFDTSDPGIRNQQLNDPSGVTVDAMGTLWVADRINDRIFGYPSAATISNGTNAARVLGQPDFNTTTGGLTASKVDGPWAVFADNANNLWVVDGNNMRVLRYANLSSIENGKPASTVIGQADYVSNVMATSARNLYNPRGVFVQPDGTLWVADLTNGRALRFATADSEAPIVTINGRRKITTKKTRVIVRGTASDDTGVTQVILRSPTKPAFATGTTVWKRTIRLKKSRTNVSAYAYDATGEVSAPAKVVIIRKARPLL
jgi:sugar lactone lactonase YvrE